ncbi:hypothetical protein TNCV_2470921 [Trichonephila clavipes]|nr:hypothetical protein TNCV_2470921 [Trichonephila clavipes]
MEIEIPFYSHPETHKDPVGTALHIQEANMDDTTLEKTHTERAAVGYMITDKRSKREERAITQDMLLFLLFSSALHGLFRKAETYETLSTRREFHKSLAWTYETLSTRPDGRGYELVSSVRALVPQTLSVEEELMHVKNVDVKSPHVGVMWKFGRGVISSGIVLVT